MHGPTCIFWANLTPVSLLAQPAPVERTKVLPLHGGAASEDAPQAPPQIAGVPGYEATPLQGGSDSEEMPLQIAGLPGLGYLPSPQKKARSRYTLQAPAPLPDAHSVFEPQTPDPLGGA
jgi:hypothetical protein